ncbi:hypothetical protein V6Z11_A11G320700 [Gossypium hirsutum]
MSAALPSTVLCCIAVDRPLLHRHKHLFYINISPETTTQKRDRETGKTNNSTRRKKKERR